MNPNVILGDGLDGMFSLREGCASLVLCDLPSGETEAEFDVPLDLGKLFSATWHALKPDGIAVFMASRILYAIDVINADSHAFRYDYVWTKQIATGFLNAKKRPLRAHEHVLVFSRKVGLYQPQMIETGVPIAKNGKSTSGHGENYGNIKPGANVGLSRAGATDRYPTSVLRDPCLGATHPNRRHPQQKPDALFRRIIATYTRPGEIVLDPCAGSGTTYRAAEAEGRVALCWDTSPRFACPI